MIIIEIKLDITFFLVILFLESNFQDCYTAVAITTSSDRRLHGMAYVVYNIAFSFLFALHNPSSFSPCNLFLLLLCLLLVLLLNIFFFLFPASSSSSYSILFYLQSFGKRAYSMVSGHVHKTSIAGNSVQETHLELVL